MSDTITVTFTEKEVESIKGLIASVDQGFREGGQWGTGNLIAYSAYAVDFANILRDKFVAKH
jgi:hypothetical protein